MAVLKTVVAGVALAMVAAAPALAAEDGLARTPPLGWRSWNQYHREITQEIIEATARSLALKRDSAGRPDPNGTSLKDLGFVDVGLDDNWQACGTGLNGTFHDANGNPLVNHKRFPDLGKMVDYIHGLGLEAGFYVNNCVCRELEPSLWPGDKHYEGDVAAVRRWGFDSVKLDHCGSYIDLDKWYKLFNKAGERPLLLEDCHDGRDGPHGDWCPYHMFRVSGDINNHWGSFYSELQHTRRYRDAQKPLSRPGCWAYPDMMQVGRLSNYNEDRAHFGAWAISSSPMILGHNATDEPTMRRIWPIISNARAIRINQAWAGHPGRVMYEAKGSAGRKVQVWVKPLGGGSIAVFAINDNNSGNDALAVPMESLGLPTKADMQVTNVYTGAPEHSLLDAGVLHIRVGHHDSAFFQLDPAPGQPPFTWNPAPEGAVDEVLAGTQWAAAEAEAQQELRAELA